MTPREKAVRLVDRYLDEVFNQTDVNFPLELPKRLAIIAVNEIIRYSPNKPTEEYDPIEYFKNVKQELEKL